MNYGQLKGWEVSGSGDTFASHSQWMPSSLSGAALDSTSAFCEEGAGKQALGQSLGLLLQGFSGENTYI